MSDTEFDPTKVLSDPIYGRNVPDQSTAMAFEEWARMFHETYERLAPRFGYKTRGASAFPWDKIAPPLQRLMIATCTEVIQACEAAMREPGRCGKHPKVCYHEHEKRCWGHTRGESGRQDEEYLRCKLSAGCMWCIELAAKDAEIASILQRAITCGDARRELELQVAAHQRELDAVRALLESIEPTVEFYLKREIESPSNHQEFAREAHEKLMKFRAALAAAQGKPKEG